MNITKINPAHMDEKFDKIFKERFKAHASKIFIAFMISWMVCAMLKLFGVFQFSWGWVVAFPVLSFFGCVLISILIVVVFFIQELREVSKREKQLLNQNPTD